MKDSSRAKTGLLNNKRDNNQEETCPWHINSEKHYNCLWIYIIDKSAADGSMVELVQSEIANLLGWSNTKTHFMLKQAMVELIAALQKHNAKELISNSQVESSDFTTFNIEPVIDSTSKDE